MSHEEILESICKYNELIGLVKAKIKVIERCDDTYCTGLGIESIDFEDSAVCVEFDDSCWGCYDKGYFNFPTTWLSVSDEDLQKIVTTAKELRLEHEKAMKAERDLKEKLKKETAEREEFERLKKKFGQ